MKTLHCPTCNKKIELDKVSFREECPHCLTDLHSCKVCKFFDLSFYRECREPSAEYVKDKGKNNYCEYFSPSDINFNKNTDSRVEQLKAAESLFKK